jgi:hypothetical protein
MDEIMRTQIPTIKRFPQQCKNAVTKSFTSTMRACYSTSGETPQLRAFKLMFMFYKCVCRMQPQIRGGKKKRLKRSESLRTALLARVARWDRGEYAELWAEACTAYSDAKSRPPRDSTEAGNIQRARECAQDARYGKAVAALLSLGTAPVSRKSVLEMKAKHPEAESPELPDGPPPAPLQFDEETVRKKVDSFPAGSAAGASGTRPQFFKDMLACPNKSVGDDALKALTKLTNLLVSGSAICSVD